MASEKFYNEPDCWADTGTYDLRDQPYQIQVEEVPYHRTSFRDTVATKGEHTFEDEIRQVINRWSEENPSNTPDFILARYLLNCLDTFNIAVQTREEWYGRKTFFSKNQIDDFENSH